MRRKVTKRASLDMPLAKGRVATSKLVFTDDGCILALANLENPVQWRFQLARSFTTKAADLAASFNPYGSRHNVLFKDVPAAQLAPDNMLPAGAPAIDGQTEFGLQTDDDHEYFVSKFGDLVGVLRVKRTPAGWSAGLSKSLVPRVLSDEAVKKGLMPPAGHSGLPKSLESVVPTEYRYWQSTGPEAIAMRDALVESGFFTEDTVKAVDGELRKVDVKYFVYEPDAGGGLAKSLPPLPTLAARVAALTASFDKVFAPMAAADWLEELDKNDAPDVLSILSPPDRTTSPREMARAAATLKGAFLLEHEDTKIARDVFSRAGQVFKLAGEPTRIFCSSFAPMSKSVVWLAKAADGTVKKTVTYQGIKVSIDRPKGFVQTGKDADGNDWSRTYQTDYGFIPRTNGGDGGSLDVFMGPSAKSDAAFWVSQKKADGSFDEFKIFLGFDSVSEVLNVFKAHIPLQFFGGISEMPVTQMKALLNLDLGEVTKAVRAAVVKIAGISYDQLRSLVNDALSAAYKDQDDGSDNNGCCPTSCGVYCDDVYDDHAIFYQDGKSFSQSFTYADGAVTLQGQPTRVMRTYVPVGAAGAQPPPATDMAMRAAKRDIAKREVRVALAKDADQHYALGIVLEPDIVDAQNDTYDAGAIRKAFEQFAEHYRNVGLMHKQVINDRVSIVENYIAPSDFDLDGTAIKKGTWLMGVRVNDPTLWAGVKDGSITGFSIGGSAIRKPDTQGV